MALPLTPSPDGLSPDRPDATAPDGAPDLTSVPQRAPLPDGPAGRLPRALDEFVLLWGEMATQWGINRTMAQIHALLYASERPLDTDEIMERLQISRGNANMNLRALLDWNLARKTHQIGSRKDYFVGEKDVWTITTTIIEERQRREIKPVQRALSAVATGLRGTDDLTPDEAAFTERVEALVSLIDLLDGFTSTLLPFLKGRSAEKVYEIVRFASRLRGGAAPAAPSGDAP
jgi:DNA-binding transcriptional regulator GbsR (MarR family)